MRKKKNAYGSSMKWKIILLIVGITSMVGLVIFQYNKRERKVERKVTEQEELQRKNQNETEETIQKSEGSGEEETKEKGSEGNVSNSGTQEDERKVEIINLDEYALKLMGKNTGLLNERLSEWMEDYQLEVKEGTIIHVMVPASDPQSINFYIRLSDERGSLVLLTYHPRENIVTASQCSYTEEEIQAEVWEADNGPAVRDVSPQEDTGGNPEEENGSMEGESMEQEGEQTSDITGDIAEQN